MALGPLLGSCLSAAPSWACCGIFRGLCTARSPREYWQPGLISGHLPICTFSPEAHGRPGAALQLGIGSVNRAGSNWSPVGSLCFPVVIDASCHIRIVRTGHPLLPYVLSYHARRLCPTHACNSPGVMQKAGRQTSFPPLGICITEDTIPASKVLHSAGAPGILWAIVTHCDAPNDRYINTGCFGRSRRST